MPGYRDSRRQPTPHPTYQFLSGALLQSRPKPSIQYQPIHRLLPCPLPPPFPASTSLSSKLSPSPTSSPTPSFSTPSASASLAITFSNWLHNASTELNSLPTAITPSSDRLSLFMLARTCSKLYGEGLVWILDGGRMGEKRGGDKYNSDFLEKGCALGFEVGLSLRRTIRWRCHFSYLLLETCRVILGILGWIEWERVLTLTLARWGVVQATK